MRRLFQEHKIRKTEEIGGLWEFYTAEEEAAAAQKVMVPGCWENYPGYEAYKGKAYYKKTVTITEEMHVRFCFEGIGHTAKVWLDGSYIASHYNAYTAFHAEAGKLSKGEHILIVEADNSFSEESALHIPNDYHSYGGIIRPVMMEYLEETFIEFVHFTPYKKGQSWCGKIEGMICSMGINSETDLVFRLDDRQIAVKTVQLETREQSFKFDIEFPDVISYELDAPRLYQLETDVFCQGRWVDDFITRVGFREIRIQKENILFNDKPVRLQGVNRHEDHPMFGAALPPEAMMQDIQLMKDMGVNAVRTSHYPNDQRFLDLCDEFGILVWEESHARGLSEEQMKHKNFRKQSLLCIDEMIREHYNHPVIFIWGILNECASNTEYGKRCYEEQFLRIRGQDASRPVTFASCHYESDICLDLVDVVSMNIYPGWYFDTPAGQFTDEVYNWVQTTEGAGKPCIISEIGAGAIPGYHASSKVKWSEERQRDLLDEQIKGVMAQEQISGLFLWQFCDCRVSEEWFASRPRSMNNKGILDEYRRPKLGYEVVKKLFTTENK